jgi:hypothetical protein
VGSCILNYMVIRAELILTPRYVITNSGTHLFHGLIRSWDAYLYVVVFGVQVRGVLFLCISVACSCVFECCCLYEGLHGTDAVCVVLNVVYTPMCQAETCSEGKRVVYLCHELCRR